MNIARILKHTLDKRHPQPEVQADVNATSGAANTTWAETSGGYHAIVWPPQVVNNESLGYLRDASGYYYPTDIGRSTQFSNGAVIYQFGDTFCHDDKKDFVGLTPNAAAIVPDIGNPTYMQYEQRGGLIPDLIPLFEDEKNDEKLHKIWSFSGVVEYARDQNNIYGWTWYEMRKGDKNAGGDPPIIYTGVAKVVYHHNTNHPTVTATREEHDRALFDANQPLWGCFTAVGDWDHVYVYGHKSTESKDVVVGRAPILEANNRSKYEFWDGTNWGKSQNYATVMGFQQHGQVFKTTMFGADSPYTWAFVGCNCFADSKVILGRAKAPQGPWEMEDLMVTYQFMDEPSDFTYCMYPHLWASNEKQGKLMVSWSEGTMRGRVIAAMLHLKMQ